jgi:hypothetical protein
MAITYTWQIVSLEAKAQQDNHDNVIFNVHWRLDAYKIDNEIKYHASRYGVEHMKYDVDNFTAYDDLTKEIVVGWLEDALDVETIKSNLSDNINLQINPVDVHLTPNWE